MKQIKKRRRILRIGNPIGFSLFCLVCLALLAGLYLGIAWAIKNGPRVVKAMRTAVQEEVMATATVEPSLEPKDELLPTPTPAAKETPALGTPDYSTPSPEPTAYASAGPAQTPAPSLEGQIIGVDAARDDSYKNKEEADYNLELAYRLKRHLENRGATVVLSRTGETEGKLESKDRGIIFKKANCTYAVRLMCNHINAKTSACFAFGSKENKAFAQKMIDTYVAATGMKKQSGKKNGVEVKSEDVTPNCGCPCVTMVLGNWDNDKDRSNLQDDAFMDTICEAICDGLIAHIYNQPAPTKAP